LDGKGNSSGKEGVDNALWEIFGENKDKAEEQNQGQGEVGKETGKEANKTTSQENNSGASVRLRKPKESFREDDEKENQEVEYTPPETSTPSIFATINPGRIHIGYPDEPPNGTTRKEDTD